MTAEETKVIGEWMGQWSGEKMEMLYLRNRIADLERSLDHVSKTSSEMYKKDIDNLTNERDSARRKLFNCIMLINDIRNHLLRHGKMTNKFSSFFIDAMNEFKKENDIVVIEDRMAK